MKHQIYIGDCIKRIKEIPDGSVSLTVTSPPYFNAKNYSGKEGDIGKNDDYMDYFIKIDELINEIHRVTVPGGIVCWNTSPVLEDGYRHMVPQDTHNFFVKGGNFVCRDWITWKKPDGASMLRCGAWIRNNGKPLTYHPNLVSETIAVYKKDGKKREREYDNIKKYYNPIPKDLMTDVWLFNPETSCHWHPAPFPLELAKRCILLYSFKGDIVLDPFAGSLTVTKVANELGRNSMAIELNEEYIEKAKHKFNFNQKSLFGDEYEIK